jgi:dihydroneopterin aldolase
MARARAQFRHESPVSIQRFEVTRRLDSVYTLPENADMSDHLVIKDLGFQGHIGITQEERRNPQPIGVDMELDYPEGAMASASQSDDITRAVDYAAVAARIVEIGLSREFQLLETLANHVTAALFAEFPIDGLRLWVRKLVPPVKNIHGSVGVRVDRRRSSEGYPSCSSSMPEDADLSLSSFLADHLEQLPMGNILDVAAGRGRNTVYLASRGFRVEAIDRDQEALGVLQKTLRQRSLANVTAQCTDLEAHPDLAKERYEGVIVFFYLQRNLFPALVNALRPGGVLIYETFLLENHLRHNHPRRREFCLEPNELLRLIGGLRVIYYDEGQHPGAHDGEAPFTARVIAVKD